MNLSMMWIRRAFIVASVLLSLCLWASPVRAGSYLDRAALLIDSSRLERDMVRPRANDKELLRMVHGIAEARSRMARNMHIPKAVALAHPHLLLMLENSERAYAAALTGDLKKFLVCILRARAEDKTFRALIRKFGYTLPLRKRR